MRNLLFIIIVSLLVSICGEATSATISEKRSIDIVRGQKGVEFIVEYHLYTINGEPVNGKLEPRNLNALETAFQAIFDEFSIDTIRNKHIKPEILNWEIETRLSEDEMFYIVRIADFRLKEK